MSNTKSNTNHLVRCAGAALVLAGTALWATAAQSQVLALNSDRNFGSTYQTVPDRGMPEETDVTARFRRQTVDYPTAEAPGTVIVDTPNTYLYFVLGGGKAVRYGIGVGRDGFTWSGVKTIERKTEWPDWFPPSDMLARQPYLPRFMAGGPGNPLGARAMYLSGSVYRIHGTNAPDTIGKHVSSGCIRMVNDDVVDLFSRTHVGTKVVVLPMHQQEIAHQARTPGRLHSSSIY